MNARHSLLFQKVNDTAKTLKDLVDNFSFVVLDEPRLEGKENAEVYSQTWHGEEGEDAFIPSIITTKAFDWQVKIGTMGSSASVVRNNTKTLFDYLKGYDEKGAALMIYSPYQSIGRQNVYFKSDEPVEYWTDSAGMSHAVFKITFRITDPTTLIVPNNSTNPTSLVEYTSTNVSSGGATATGHDFGWGDASASDSGG